MLDRDQLVLFNHPMTQFNFKWIKPIPFEYVSTSDPASCLFSLICSCLHFSMFLWCMTIRLRIIAYSTKDRNTSNIHASNQTYIWSIKYCFLFLFYNFMSLLGSANCFPDYTNCCATIEILIETCLHGCNSVGHRDASSKKVLLSVVFYCQALTPPPLLSGLLKS